MYKKSYGFTLLEAVFAVFLFSLLLGSLGSFFGKMYTNVSDFNKKAYLMEDADATKQTIINSIREAGSLKLETNIPLEDDMVADKIVFKLILQPGTAEEHAIIVRKNALGNNMGKYRAIYQKGIGANQTETVISDQIKSFIFEHKPLGSGGSFKFNITFASQNESKSNIEVKVNFEESIDYKTYITR